MSGYYDYHNKSIEPDHILEDWSGVFSRQEEFSYCQSSSKTFNKRTAFPESEW